MTGQDVDRLVQDALIIRNRGKIQATVDNARAMMTASPSLATLAKSYATTRKQAPMSTADLPKSTPQAEAFAKQLKSQGYRYVGPTSVYAFMQNVGVVNDHIHGCFRAADYAAEPGHGASLSERRSNGPLVTLIVICLAFAIAPGSARRTGATLIRPCPR
jgi:DNA-3-methyladenine glycosylase I